MQKAALQPDAALLPQCYGLGVGRGERRWNVARLRFLEFFLQLCLEIGEGVAVDS